MKKLLILACITASAVLVPGAVSADNDHQNARHTIEGAWEVVTTVRMPAEDCTTSPMVGGPNPFAAFNTFHEGGTMSEWGSRSPPKNRSSGHGVWERIGHDRYGYRLMFHSFDEDGRLTATMDIRTRIKLSRNGDTFTAVSRFVRTDLGGNVLNFCATMEGVRFTY